MLVQNFLISLFVRGVTITRLCLKGSQNTADHGFNVANIGMKFSFGYRIEVIENGQFTNAMGYLRLGNRLLAKSESKTS